MTKKSEPLALADLFTAFNQFPKERARVSAIVAAAWVDDALKALLEVYLSRDQKIASNLLRFDAPLGNFGVRIKLAYLLGLIDSDIRSDLDSIREIRNEFAHVRTRVSFKTERVVAKCNSLKSVQGFEPLFKRRSTSRERFMFSALIVAHLLISLSNRAKPPEPLADGSLRLLRNIAGLPSFHNLIAKINELEMGEA